MIEEGGGSSLLNSQGERQALRAGKDATEPFEDVGHSDDARAQLEKMYIGDFTGPVSVGRWAIVSVSVSGSPWRSLSLAISGRLSFVIYDGLL